MEFIPHPMRDPNDDDGVRETFYETVKAEDKGQNEAPRSKLRGIKAILRRANPASL